jgi:hypothetical protein
MEIRFMRKSKINKIKSRVSSPRRQFTDMKQKNKLINYAKVRRIKNLKESRVFVCEIYKMLQKNKDLVLEINYSVQHYQ